MKLNLILATGALAFATAIAHAHSFKLGDIDIGHPYARATVPGQPTGGGYLKLDNKGRDDKLLSARAAVSASVELHSMRMEGDVMRMRQVEGIALPAGQKVALEPGGLHIMFVGLKAPLKVGDKFPMTLKFEKAGEVEVIVNVEAPRSGAAASGHAH
ncbi:MAG: copper chaperone PCu(A)C [Rhizobiales bacterium]|nr:copper chaperone PCu(A)C [Rhizobacter sp.]